MNKTKKAYIIAAAMVLTVVLLIILDNTVFRDNSSEGDGFFRNFLFLVGGGVPYAPQER